MTGDELYQISTRTGIFSNDRVFDGYISMIICSNGNCCNITNMDNPVTSGFQRGSLDIFTGSALDYCDGFVYDPTDLNLTVFRPLNSASYVWRAWYVQLQATNGNEIRCQKDNGTVKFELMSNDELMLNCTQAPASKCNLSI